MTASPVLYRPDIEQVGPDEDATIKQLNAAFDTILEQTAQDYGHAVRAVHAKAHGVLEGELTVDGGLPPELAQGLFAIPGTHRVLIRLSTNAGDILPDSIGLPLGLAMKVFDVGGGAAARRRGQRPGLRDGQQPRVPGQVRDKFLGSLKMLAKTTDWMEGAKKVASAVLSGVRATLAAVGVTSPAVNSLGGTPNLEPLGETYYSVTPVPLRRLERRPT